MTSPEGVKGGVSAPPFAVRYPYLPAMVTTLADMTDAAVDTGDTERIRRGLDALMHVLEEIRAGV